MTEFNPDWCIAPGEILREWIEENHLSTRVLAVACAMDRDRLEKIIVGTRKLSQIDACKLWQGTGISARIWLRLEEAYRAGLAAGKTDSTDKEPLETPDVGQHAVEVLAVCRRIVAAQAEDDALWDPSSVVEAYVVQELRALHKAVEGDLSVVAAVEDP